MDPVFRVLELDSIHGGQVKVKSRYTQEFKDQAVKLSVMPETSVDQVARDLGISPGTLVAWRHKAGITVSRSGVRL
jgi:transposase-like protein